MSVSYFVSQNFHGHANKPFEIDGQFGHMPLELFASLYTGN